MKKKTKLMRIQMVRKNGFHHAAITKYILQLKTIIETTILTKKNLPRAAVVCQVCLNSDSLTS